MTELIPICPLCGGKIEEKETEKIIRVSRDIVILKLKAGVCQHCTEKSYTKETHEKIKEIRSKLKEKIKELKPAGHTYVYVAGT